MAKIDLHRHLGGSLTPIIIWHLLQRQCPYNEIDVDDIAATMTYSDEEKKNIEPFSRESFTNFLKKFDTINKVEWDEYSTAMSIRQVVWDLMAESIDYAEIHFTIGKYLDLWTPKDIILFIADKFEEECKKWQSGVGLVLCLKYESDREKQREIAAVIEDPDIGGVLCGINLVGDEAFYDAEFYEPIFRDWKKAGKGLVAHVGESGPVQNIDTAISILGVDRIAHGIKIADKSNLISKAREHDICFDVALTSNILTGVVNDIKNHPIKRMVDSGLSVTIGTDDPVQCGVTLDSEYALLKTELDMSDNDIMAIMMNSVDYSFRTQK